MYDINFFVQEKGIKYVLVWDICSYPVQVIHLPISMNQVQAALCQSLAHRLLSYMQILKVLIDTIPQQKRGSVTHFA